MLNTHVDNENLAIIDRDRLAKQGTISFTAVLHLYLKHCWPKVSSVKSHNW